MVEKPEAFSEDDLQRIFIFANQYLSKIREVNKLKKRNNFVSVTNKQNRTLDLKEQITSYINCLLESSIEKGMLVLEISSGEIHKAMNLKNRVPSV